MTQEFKCKNEAIREDGTKIMEYTKDKVYFALEDVEDGYHIEDDNGNYNYFFNTTIMFTKATTL